MAEPKQAERIPDRIFFAGACLLFLAITLALAALAGIFSGSVWYLGDTRIFLRMADLIAQGGTPYVDLRDPKPPLIFFLLALPASLGAGLEGGLLLVALADCASAIALLAIGWRLYGRNAGLFAGLAFSLGVTWAQGYFVLTEPFALTFILLAVLLLTSGMRHRYMAAGVCAGLAIGFKQYALLMVPLALFYAWQKDEVRKFPAFVAGLLLPLAALFAAMFLLYGTEAGFASLYWSFGMTSSYLAGDPIQDVPVYQIDSPAVAFAWIVLSLGFFFTPILLAAASAIRWRPRAEEQLFILAAVLFAATLLIRPFLHYWAFVLPFLVLLVARAFGKPGGVWPLPVPEKPAAIAALSGVVSAVLLFGSATATWVLMSGFWRPRAIVELYGLADIVLKATAGYFGHVPEPVAASWHGPGIATVAGSVFSVAGLGVISAVVVTGIAWRLYGRGPALLAGALFAAGSAFALGYMLPTDALAVLLVVASSYFLLSGPGSHVRTAGLLAGITFVLKPLLILLLPAMLYLMWREKKGSAIPGLIVVSLAPITLLSVLTGGRFWSGLSVDTFSHAAATLAYDVPDALLAMLNLAAAGAFVTITAVVALAAFLYRRATPAEEYLLFSMLLILVTLCFGRFTHDWLVALPFAAILCARLFSGDQKVIMSTGE